MKTFASVAELTAQTLKAGEKVRLDRRDSGGQLIAGLIYEVQTGVTPVTGRDITLANANIAVLNNDVFNLTQMGLVPDSASNQTTLFNTLMAAIPDGSIVEIDAGSYLISGGLVDTKNNLTISAKGNVRFYHPVEGDTGRVVTQKNIDFDTCTGIKIFGIKCEGEHTNVALGDNAYQSGIGFLNSSDCKVYFCEGEDLQRCFIASGCTNIRYFDCKAKTTYTGFLATNSSSKVYYKRCNTEDSYWGKQFEGVATPIATGYGILIDASSDCVAEGCESIRSGSDCFRSSGTGASRNRFINCVSRQARRNAFSHREATALDNQSTNCNAYDVGDPSFWSGSAGTYTEPSAVARGHLVEADRTTVTGGSITNNIVEASSNLFDGIRVDADDCKIESVVGYGAVTSAGIIVTSASNRASVINNNWEMQELGSVEGKYCLNVGGDDHRIEGNRTKGGLDGILCLASNTDVIDNKIGLCGRHGIQVSGAGGYIDANRILNSGTITTGAGLYIVGTDCTSGTNEVTDDRGTALINYAVWIAASGTGYYEGQAINRNALAGLRDDAGAAARASAVFGKAATATDAASIIANMKAAGLMET